HQKMSDARLVHSGHGRLVVHFGVGSDDARGHHLAHGKGGGIKTVVQHAPDNVALRENTGQPVAIEHDDDAHVVVGHQTHRIADWGLFLYREEEPRSHDVAELLHRSPSIDGNGGRSTGPWRRFLGYLEELPKERPAPRKNFYSRALVSRC